MTWANLPEYAECDNPNVPEDEIDDLPCDESCPYFEEDNDCRYTPSSTYGDYGPGNPWDAPGMSVKDFI
jgi:hypothetical protein